jgi:UDP-N-acetylglucosamine transferase subunit ALG13
MILVTVGTNEAPFDRLLGALATLPRTEDLVVQHGPSRIRPPGATCIDFLSYEELALAIGRARTVVMHAGVGSIMTALASGKRPVVVARLERFGEAVDDHQLALGLRLHEAGLVTLVEDLDRLAELVGGASSEIAIELGPSRRLVADLKTFVDARRRTPASGERRG